MRIFIYAQGRSGGNTIQKALAEILNLRPCWIKEFDNAIIDPVAFEEALKEDNIIIKLHLWQCVGNFDNQTDFLKYVYTKFDKVLYHGRGNSFDTNSCKFAILAASSTSFWLISFELTPNAIFAEIVSSAKKVL